MQDQRQQGACEPFRHASHDTHYMPPDQDQPENPSEPAQEPEQILEGELPSPPDEKEEELPSPPAPASPAAPPSGQEKRQSARHNVRWRCLLLIGGNKIPAMVVDFSDGGMCFVAGNSLPANTRVEIAIFIPDAKNPGAFLVSSVTIEIVYSVLRRQEFKFGAKFVNPSATFLERARAAIRRDQS